MIGPGRYGPHSTEPVLEADGSVMLNSFTGLSSSKTLPDNPQKHGRRYICGLGDGNSERLVCVNDEEGYQSRQSTLSSVWQRL